MSVEAKISALIKSQFPAFMREEYPKAQDFLEAYYEWLESEYAPIDVIKNIRTYTDIDRTFGQFLDFFKDQFLANIPKTFYADGTNSVNVNNLIKNIKPYYRARGVEKSFRLFFHILWNLNVEFYYPAKDLARVSDGKWSLDKTVRTLIYSGDPYGLEGKAVIGSGKWHYENSTGDRQDVFESPGNSWFKVYEIAPSNTRGVVEFVRKLQIDAYTVYELFLSPGITQAEFNINEWIIEADTNYNQITISPIVVGTLPSIKQIEVVDRGDGYSVGDLIDIPSPGGVGAGAKIQVKTINQRNVELSLPGNGMDFRLGEIVYQKRQSYTGNIIQKPVVILQVASGSGNFVLGETVSSGSLKQATVISWVGTELIVSPTVGTFEVSDIVVGETSLSQWAVATIAEGTNPNTFILENGPDVGNYVGLPIYVTSGLVTQNANIWSYSPSTKTIQVVPSLNSPVPVTGDTYEIKFSPLLSEVTGKIAGIKKLADKWILTLDDITGTFSPGESVVGVDSDAQYQVLNVTGPIQRITFLNHGVGYYENPFDAIPSAPRYSPNNSPNEFSLLNYVLYPNSPGEYVSDVLQITKYPITTTRPNVDVDILASFTLTASTIAPSSVTITPTIIPGTFDLTGALQAPTVTAVQNNIASIVTKTAQISFPGITAHPYPFLAALAYVHGPIELTGSQNSVTFVADTLGITASLKTPTIDANYGSDTSATVQAMTSALQTPEFIGQPVWSASNYGTVLAEFDFSLAANLLNNSNGQAANNEGVKKVSAASGSYDLIQPDTDGQPILKTNIQNGKQVLDFSNGQVLMIVKSSDNNDWGNIGSNLAGITMVFVNSWPGDTSTFLHVMTRISDDQSNAVASLAISYEAGYASYYSDAGNNSGNTWSAANKRGTNSWGVSSARINYTGNNIKIDDDVNGNIVNSALQYNISGNNTKTFTAKASTTNIAYSDCVGSSSPYIQPGGLYDFTGRLGHVIIYSGALSDATLTSLYTALKTYWGIS